MLPSPKSPALFVSAHSFKKRLFSVVLLINLFVIAMAGVFLFQSGQQHKNRISVQVQSLSKVLELTIETVLRKADVVLLAVVDEAEEQIAIGRINGHTLNAYIAKLHARIPEFEGILVTNARGEIIHSTALLPNPPVSVADRDYFIHALNNAQPELFISKPVISRFSNTWTVFVSRRINNPDGSFAGVVTGSLPIEYFHKLFASIDVGKQGSIVLRDKDLAVVARYTQLTGGDLSSIGSNKITQESRQQLFANNNSGIYTSRSAVDNIERMLSYRKISDYPLYIFVGRASRDYLSEWRRDATKILSMVILFNLGTILASCLLYRSWKIEFQAQKAQRESEKLFEVAFKHAPIGMVLSSVDGRLLSVNRSFCKMVGYLEEELLAKSLTEITCPDDLEDDLKQTRQILCGEISSYQKQKRFFHCHGTFIWVIVNMAVLRDDQDQPRYLISQINNITAQKKMEAELQYIQKIEMVQQLTGGIIHEFNNILTVIVGLGNMSLMQMQEDDPIRNNIEQILDASDRAANLTRSLLAFTRKQKFIPNSFNLNITIHYVEKFLKKVLGEEIQLLVNCHESNLTVYADRNLLEFIMYNLAIKARTSMPDGGYLLVDTKAICIDEQFMKAHGYGKPGWYAQLTVMGSGAELVKDSILKRLDPITATNEVAADLDPDLVIIYGIIKQHKGYLTAFSSNDDVTIIKMFIPLITGEPDNKEKASLPAIEGGRETILVADDDPGTRYVVKSALSLLGYTVIEARHGNDAIRKYGEHKDTIDLLLFDIVMPKRNGIQAYYRIREHAPKIKVIFMSGYYNETDEKDALHKEGLEVLDKPFKVKDLARKVRDTLDTSV